MQPAFVEALLAVCRSKRIHTALDTCGFAPPEIIRRISAYVDLFLYDLKVMDGERHRRYTSVKNDLILENLKLLAETGKAVVVRIPVIPNVNDSVVNLEELTAFLNSLSLRDIDLLPYHHIASDKYHRLQLCNRMEGVKPPTAEQMNSIATRLTRDGFSVRIGG